MSTSVSRARASLVAAATLGCITTAVATAVSFLWLVGDLPPALVPYRLLLSTLRAPHGVPLEFGLSMAFGLLLLLSARAEEERMLSSAFLLSTALVGVSIGLAVGSRRSLFLWLPVIAAFAAMMTSAAARGNSARRLRSMPRDLLLALGSSRLRTAVVVWALSALVVAQFLSSHVAAISRTDAQRHELVTWFASGRAIAQPELMPPPGAHRVVVFSDYQCPFCRAMVPQFESIVAAARSRGANIRIELRDFPLASGCNDAVSTTIHALACEMAVAARLVRDSTPGAADGFDAWLYRHGDQMTKRDLVAQLATMHLADAYAGRYDEFLAAVRRDTELGARVGVLSTPSVFLDGIRLPSVTPIGLSELVERQIAAH